MKNYKITMYKNIFLFQISIDYKYNKKIYFIKIRISLQNYKNYICCYF